MTLIVPTGFTRRFYFFHCSNHCFIQAAGGFLPIQQGKMYLYRGCEKYCRWTVLGRLWCPQEHQFQTPAGTSGIFHRIQVGINTTKAVIERTVAFWRVKLTEEMCVWVPGWFWVCLCCLHSQLVLRALGLWVQMKVNQWLQTSAYNSAKNELLQMKGQKWEIKACTTSRAQKA